MLPTRPHLQVFQALFETRDFLTLVLSRKRETGHLERLRAISVLPLNSPPLWFMDQRSLIEDLDARQNEVLAQLDQLNERVESLLKDWLAARDKATHSAEE
jgi:hypothetical protein